MHPTIANITNLVPFPHNLAAHSLHTAYLVSKVIGHFPELTYGLAKDEVIIAAVLHDLAKVNWPERWFTAPLNELSGDEIKEMRLHPVRGAQMAGRLNVSKAVTMLIAEHHERSGGRGYPRSITHPHPASLVISTCDAYAACREHRAYREKSLSVADALREAGRVGCPEAVKVLEHLARGGYYLEQHCS